MVSKSFQAETDFQLDRESVKESKQLVGFCYYCSKPADNRMPDGNFICDKCITISIMLKKKGWTFCVHCGQYEGGYCHHYKTEVPRTFYTKCNAPKEEKK